MPAAVAIPLIAAGIGGATSIAGGLIGSSAAGKAGKIQSAAASQQADLLQKILEQYNPKIGEAATAAGTGATAAADTAIGGVNDAVTAGGDEPPRRRDGRERLSSALRGRRAKTRLLNYRTS